MTPAQKADFLEFCCQNLSNHAPKARVRSGIFLQFGYRENYGFEGLANYHVEESMASGVNDDGKTALANVLAHVLPLVRSGHVPTTNRALFEFSFEEEQMIFTEQSLAGMTLRLGHVFNIKLYEDVGQLKFKPWGIAPTVLHDRNGVPITLATMTRLVTASRAPTPSAGGII